MPVPLRPMTLLIAAALSSAMLLAGCSTTKRAAEPNVIVDEFDAAPDRAPTEATLLAMANILIARGQDEQAAYVLRRIIQRYPDSPRAYNALAELLMRHDELDAAVQTLDTGLAIAPQDARLHNNRGVAAMTSGDYDAAIEHFDHAIQLAPRNKRYHNNKATAAGLNGDYDAALEGFKVGLSEREAHHNLALICDALGDHERAAAERQLAVPPQ